MTVPSSSGKLLDGNDQNLGFNAATDVYENLVKAGVDRPDQGRAHRAAGCGFGRRPADHHRSGDQRDPGRQDSGAGGMPDMGGMGGMGGMGF